MKFFGMDEKAAISSMEDRRKGCYPIGNNGIWHAGQHIYFGKENAMIENPVTGIMVAGNFSSDKKWNYIVLENDIRFPHQKEADNGFHCYNVISNIRAKNGYDNLIGAESDITEEVLEKIKELPFYVTVQLKLPKNTCTDKYNYKSFYRNLDCSYIKEKLTSEASVKGLSEAHISACGDSYHIPAQTEIFSRSKKYLGVLKSDSIVLKNSTSINGEMVRLNSMGSNLEIADMPAGLYVFAKDETVDKSGNVILRDKTKLHIWNEKETTNTYPGFGIVIDKKNHNIQKILSDKKFSEGFEECKTRIEELMNSIDTENACIYVVNENEKKDLFPHYIGSHAKNSNKITDKTGNIISIYVLTGSDYEKLQKKLTGLWKYPDDWWKTANDLWDGSGLQCVRMEKTDISGAYDNFFDAVKLTDEKGKGYEKYDIGQTRDAYAAVKPYCLPEGSYEVSAALKNVYEKVRNISDTKAENIYAFASAAEVRSGVPYADAQEKAEGLKDIDRVQDFLEGIENKAAYMWIQSGGRYIYLKKEIIAKLKITVSKNEPKKGDIIPAGAKLGFAYNGEESKPNVISEKKPYVDYALFFTEDITGRIHDWKK